MVKSWILPQNATISYKLQSQEKPCFWKWQCHPGVAWTGTHPVTHWVRPELPAELGVKAVPSFNIYYTPRKCWLLGTGSVPKVTAGKCCTPKELGQASCILIYSLASFGKQTGMKQQNFQESHCLSQLPFGETDSESSFDFFFFQFSMLINCPLGHQELDKAERSWLISSWVGEQRWRQSFLSKAPLVLSPEELKKHLGTLSNFWLQLILF